MRFPLSRVIRPQLVRPGLVLFGLALVVTAPVRAQMPPEQSIRTLSVPEGFEIKVFASEPMIINPIAVDVDTLGRVWVTEGVNYRRNVSDPPDNKIKVLEDTDGDGVADKMTVFTSDLNAAMGVCVAGTKIYVPESPNLYVYTDADGDLKPDGPREVLLTGFGGKNHDHGVHSQVFGPDHKLYMTNGDTGYNVTGPDGSHIQFQWGGMIRCEADGSKLEDFAVNFRNPVELAVDSYGHVWCSDNDNDGLKSVRICWILEGGNYGWFGRPENIRNPDGSFDPINHWRANIPGFVPYALITGFGSPCGMTFYEGDAFGPEFRGTMLHSDAGPREVRRYTPKRLPGVGFSIDAQNIITGEDKYFRPVDPCVAPDGSVILTDWYDGGVGGHAYNDPDRGRIYRVTPVGKKLARAEKPGPYKSDADALVALASPNHATTFLARERLIASGAAAIPAVEALLKSDNDILQARALWVLDRIGGEGRKRVAAELQSKNAARRALAVRILRRHGEEYAPAILALAKDADGEVLCEVLLAIGSSKSPEATAALIKLFDRYNGEDRFLLETLGIAARGREAEVFAAVVDRPEIEVSPRLVNIVRILRPTDATKYLTEKLATSNLPEESRQALVTALSSLATADAGKSIAGLLTKEAPIEVKRLALAALRQNLGGAWSNLREDETVISGIAAALKDPELVVEALAVVGQHGLATFAPQTLDLLKQDKSEEAVQLVAIDVAARLNLAEASPLLALRLQSPLPSIRTAAMSSLVSLKDPRILTEVLTGKKTDAATKQQTAELLGRSSDGAVLLFRLVDTKKLDKALADTVIAAAIEHPDANVRVLFEKFVPPDQRPKTLGQAFKPDDILALTGDTGRGEAVFLRSGAASCNKCHRVKGKGSDIGPDLSQIGRKYERAALLQTIMQPSLGIAPEFVPHVVETASGKVYAGFIQEQTEEALVLRTIEGAAVRIPKPEIEALVKQEVSLMPELVLKNVTAQDASDLLAYLVSLQEATVHATAFKAIGPFRNRTPDDRGTDWGPEQKIDTAQKFAGFGGKEVAWTTVTGSVVNGFPQIDLIAVAKTLDGANENVIYYFAATLDSALAQPATFRLGSDDGIQVWVNGEKVHDKKTTRALTPGEDTVEVKLKQGKNVILLKLDQGSGPGGLSLSAEARGNLTFGVP